MCEHMDISTPKNKPVLFLINGLGRGGAEKVFMEQAVALHEMGLPVYFGSLYGSSSTEGLLAGTGVSADHSVTFDFKKFLDLRGFLNLRRFVAKNKISIVYSTLEEANTITRLLKISKPSIRVITRESNDASGKLWKFKILDVGLNFFTDKIIAVSRGVKDSLKRYQGIHADKIIVVENGINVSRDDFEILFKQKPKDAINILSVGSLTKQKNQRFLIKAFGEALGELPQTATLTIVGAGSLRGELEDFVKKSNLVGRVFLAGPVDRAKMKDFFIDSHIFILPSLWEGCPNALLEAMSYGLPAISTRVSGAEDIIEDGVSGFLVGVNNIDLVGRKIVQLALDGKLRHDMGLAARRRIGDKYSFNKNINNLISILL